MNDFGFVSFIVTALPALSTLHVANIFQTVRSVNESIVPCRTSRWIVAPVLMIETFSTFAHASIVETKLTASDGAIDDEFGVSVAIDGDTALVGAENGTRNGTV